VGIRIKHPDKASRVAIAVQQKMGPVALVRSWLHMNQNLFAALKLEKTVMFIILTLITLVAAFTIVSNLLLITAQKVREIGILQALGAPRNCIRRIFLLQGLMMGGTGVCLGTVLGIAISALLKRYQFVQLPADVYYVDKLPVRIMPADVGLVGLAAFAIVLIATLYPAYQAAKLDALTAIRQT